MLPSHNIGEKMIDGRQQFKQLLDQIRDQKRYLALVDSIDDLFDRKNAGYAGQENPDAWANFRLAEAIGISASTGVLVRISDKFSRLQSLTRDPGNDRVGESKRDTALDQAVYSLIYICLLEEEELYKNLPIDNLSNR